MCIRDRYHRIIEFFEKFNNLLRLSDPAFHEKRTTLHQMTRGFLRQPPVKIQSVFSSVQRTLRFKLHFFLQARYVPAFNVRRIAYDNVEFARCV